MPHTESLLGRHESALRRHEAVLARRDLYPESLSYIVAAFHARYGDALDAAGRTDEAIEAWRESVRIYDLRPDERPEERDAVAGKLERALADAR